MAAAPPRGPARRIILLGASNVARGISAILGTAAAVWGQPLEVFAAFGRGRSYGLPNRLLVRELSGIAQCGLWDAVGRRERLPTAALVTDIGNDLIYGRSVDEIVAWVDVCLARLAALDAQIVVTGLPIDNLARLPAWQFRLAGKIFFPRHPIDLATLTERACELDRRVADLAARHGARSVAQRCEWFKIDPIHISYWRMARAWHEVLGAWLDAPPAVPPARAAIGRALYLHSVFPERRKLFGFEQRRTQPAGKLRDGSTLWFY